MENLLEIKDLRCDLMSTKGIVYALGGVTLEFYLIHGIFVDLFGYSFADVAPSAVYIRNVPLYILAVLACSVPATALFHFLWKGTVRLICTDGRTAETVKSK